jgi:seryl-tRNA synthetase
MKSPEMSIPKQQPAKVPWFGARKLARSLIADLDTLRSRHADLQAELERERARTAAEIATLNAALQQAIGETSALGAAHEELRKVVEKTGGRSLVEVEAAKIALHQQVEADRTRWEDERRRHEAELASLKAQQAIVRQAIVETEDLALLQEAGVYHYRHPLTDAVSYKIALDEIERSVKDMTRKDGGAVLSISDWTVNGSQTEGRRMVRDFSKLLLRAFNAEADNLVRGLKPYKLDAAKERLRKVSDTIQKLGSTMRIQISPPYLQLRERELELTADFLQKQAEEKECERQERERLREERKVQQEMERERERLDKELKHYANALQALEAKGDDAGAERMRNQMCDVQKAIADVDYRAANIRAGYVYVISNIGSFGEQMVKVGLTRRLDPTERIRELSDASVPFNFDIHAIFFSRDAVGIESQMHARLGDKRVNVVNLRREFFRATPSEVKSHLVELAGELLEFEDVPEALEYRQSLGSGPLVRPEGNS